MSSSLLIHLQRQELRGKMGCIKIVQVLYGNTIYIWKSTQILSTQLNGFSQSEHHEPSVQKKEQDLPLQSPSCAPFKSLPTNVDHHFDFSLFSLFYIDRKVQQTFVGSSFFWSTVCVKASFTFLWVVIMCPFSRLYIILLYIFTGICLPFPPATDMWVVSRLEYGKQCCYEPLWRCLLCPMYVTRIGMAYIHIYEIYMSGRDIHTYDRYEVAEISAHLSAKPKVLIAWEGCMKHSV